MSFLRECFFVSVNCFPVQPENNSRKRSNQPEKDTIEANKRSPKNHISSLEAAQNKGYKPLKWFYYATIAIAGCELQQFDYRLSRAPRRRAIANPENTISMTTSENAAPRGQL